MAKLFVGPREMNFIADITRELIKDVVGQKIYYYPVSELKTQAHSLYNESPEKVFDNPIEIEALCDAAENHAVIGQFGVDATYTLEVFLQYRDMVSKGINVAIGDFFTYGATLFEILQINVIKNIYGQVEHKSGLKLVAQQARESQLRVKILGPTEEQFSDADAVQNDFVQQRGYSENKNGPTGDVRDLQKSGVLDKPLTGPKEVSSAGDPTKVGNSFYDE
jgi:hypothetical protein